MTKIIKARWILTLLGIAITLVGIGASTFNWSSCTEQEFYFGKSVTTQTSSYISIGGTRDLTSYQTAGNSTCRYNLYKRTRTNNSYNSIYTGEKYSENNTVYNVYTVKFGSWADSKFKMTKTAGTTKASTVYVAVEDI